MLGKIKHYLDNFIFILINLDNLATITQTYISITNCLSVPYNNSKNAVGTIVEILGYTINTMQIETRLSLQKQLRATKQVTAAL